MHTRTFWLLTLAVTSALSPDAGAAPFREATARWLPAPTAGWSNKVELCDIDGDNDLDVFVANGAAYNEADLPELPFFWRNEGDHFSDIGLVPTQGVPGDAFPTLEAGWWRVVKCGDVDGDGDLDVFFGGTFQSPSVLLVNNFNAGSSFAASTSLPQTPHSLGDAEFADVDGDGDGDLVVADWGDGDPFFVRGRPRLWMNDGLGNFTDETDERLPGARTGFSWDLEAVDVDDDLDLDIVVSCKVCADGGLLLQNDGSGHFLDQSAFLPGAGNNYEFEAFDFDADDDLDLFTINDGKNLGERVLRNEGGVFTADRDALADVDSEDDDNAALVFDFDSDGDGDVLIASLSGDDRVLVNDGGVFTESIVAVDGPATPGSLGIALGDLNGDGKLDLVMAQGESAFDDLVYEGEDVAVDDVAPAVGVARVDVAHSRVVVRVHDHLSPVRSGDVVVTAQFITSTVPRAATLTLAGEQQWQTPLQSGDRSVVVCAVDRRGNEACGRVVDVVSVDDDGDLVLAGGGCGGCHASGGTLAPGALALLSLLRLRRRTQRRIGAP